MKTEAIWHLGEHAIEVREVEIPEPGAEEVVVATEACGICGWDILAFSGRFGKFQAYPFSAGHEGVGRVMKKGEKVHSVNVGQRVAMHGLPIGTPGGALMARHALRSQHHVTVIPEGDLPVAFWIVAPAVCVLNGILYSRIQPDDIVGLVGAGYMGLLFVQGLAMSLVGSLTAFDVDERRLGLARQFGVSETVNLAASEVQEAMVGHFDVVTETAGTSESLRLAFNLLRPGGILENFAWNHNQFTFDLDDWHRNGWCILNIQPGMNPNFGDFFLRTVAL